MAPPPSRSHMLLLTGVDVAAGALLYPVSRPLALLFGVVGLLLFVAVLGQFTRLGDGSGYPEHHRLR